MAKQEPRTLSTEEATSLLHALMKAMTTTTKWKYAALTIRELSIELTIGQHCDNVTVKTIYTVTRAMQDMGIETTLTPRYDEETKSMRIDARLRLSRIGFDCIEFPLGRNVLTLAKKWITSTWSRDEVEA